jgi:hypothetical protein
MQPCGTERVHLNVFSNHGVANVYFATLVALVAEWASTPLPFCLPTTHTPELAHVMDYALRNPMIQRYC